MRLSSEPRRGPVSRTGALVLDAMGPTRLRSVSSSTRAAPFDFALGV